MTNGCISGSVRNGRFFEMLAGQKEFRAESTFSKIGCKYLTIKVSHFWKRLYWENFTGFIKSTTNTGKELTSKCEIPFSELLVNKFQDKNF